MEKHCPLTNYHLPWKLDCLQNLQPPKLVLKPKRIAMIFRLATSVLEKRQESISVDGAPLVPNWDSLQNLRAKIKKAAAERLDEKKCHGLDGIHYTHCNTLFAACSWEW